MRPVIRTERLMIPFPEPLRVQQPGLESPDADPGGHGIRLVSWRTGKTRARLESANQLTGREFCGVAKSVWCEKGGFRGPLLQSPKNAYEPNILLKSARK